MSSFDDRERGFEKRFALDAECEFKAQARRNKNLGRWAAEKLGLTGDAVEEYAKSVVIADLEEPGEEDVFRKLRADFDAGHVECSDRDIRREMETLLTEAREAVRDGG